MVPTASSMEREGTTGCEPDPWMGGKAETAKFCAGLSSQPRTRGVSRDFKALDAPIGQMLPPIPSVPIKETGSREKQGVSLSVASVGGGTDEELW